MSARREPGRRRPGSLFCERCAAHIAELRFLIGDKGPARRTDREPRGSFLSAATRTGRRTANCCRVRGRRSFRIFCSCNSLVNKNGGDIKTAVPLLPACCDSPGFFFHFSFPAGGCGRFHQGFPWDRPHYYKPTGSLFTIRAQKPVFFSTIPVRVNMAGNKE